MFGFARFSINRCGSSSHQFATRNAFSSERLLKLNELSNIPEAVKKVSDCSLLFAISESPRSMASCGNHVNILTTIIIDRGKGGAEERDQVEESFAVTVTNLVVLHRGLLKADKPRFINASRR
jgi:hypothetical protein